MSRIHTKSASRQGATIILMLLLLVVVFIFVAFAIDVGRIQLAQLKLQTSADLAARAAADAMSRGVGDNNNLASVEAAIRAEAQMVMQNNSLFGAPVELDLDSQVSFGLAVPSQTPNPNAVGNGRLGFSFNSDNNGNLTTTSNAVTVTPDIGQFPLVFGQFLGRDSVALGSRATAKIRDRDIVVVIDRSASMLEHDAGMINVASYDPNLLALEDNLYQPGDLYHPTGPNSRPSRHTEFEISSSGIINLSRMQATKLAILRFRKEIDESPGREQLGLVTYAVDVSRPSDVIVPTPAGGIDVTAGLSAAVRAAIVDDGITDTPDESTASTVPHEHVAAALEDHLGGYDTFDFNYLRTRWAPRTNIADGITAGTDVAYGNNTRLFARQILIVMTDGRHNNGNSTPEAAAAAAIAKHPDMQIFTITFGEGAETAPMIAVAEIGNGEYFHANNVDELVETFQHLARTAGVELIE